MSSTLAKFTLKCIPPRATKKNNKQIMRRGKGGTPFIGKSKDSKWKEAESELSALLIPHAPREPFDGALWVEVIWTMPYTKAVPQRDWGKIIPHQKRPDADNLVTGLFDVMTDCGFWHDDAQISAPAPIKQMGFDPGIAVTIRSVEPYRLCTKEVAKQVMIERCVL